MTVTVTAMFVLVWRRRLPRLQIPRAGSRPLFRNPPRRGSTMSTVASVAANDEASSKPDYIPHPMTSLRLVDGLPKCALCGAEAAFACSECSMQNVAYCSMVHRMEVSHVIRNGLERAESRTGLDTSSDGVSAR